MSKFLLVACSAHKNRFLAEGPAKEMYAGTLFALAMLYAAENNLQVLILSAKYGFISPDTVIKRYDTKFIEPYSGPWPEGEGWYVGGSLYFANAPSRFKPLLPTNLRYGKMTTFLRGLLVNPPTGAICSPRSQKVGSKTWALYEFFRDGKHTQEEAYIMLSERFGENEKMRSTIKTQLSNARMGKERGGTVHRDGEYYWFEHHPGVLLSGTEEE